MPQTQQQSKTPASGNVMQVWGLAKYLFREGRVMHSAVLPLAIVASISRAGLIFSINQVAIREDKSWMPLILLFVAMIATVASGHFGRIAKEALRARIQRDLRTELTGLLLKADVSFLQNRDQGKVYSTVVYETGNVAGSAVRIIGTVEAILLMLVCTPYLFWLSWVTGVATTLAVVVGSLGFFMTEGTARAYAKAASKATAEFCDRVNDVLAGWMELRLNRARMDGLEAHTNRLTDEIRANTVKAERLFSLGETFTQISLIGLLCAIVVALPLFQGAGTATMFQVLTLVLFTYGPIEAVFGDLPSLSRAAASKRVIEEMVQELSESRERDHQAPQPVLPGFKSIELKGVTAVLGDEASGRSGRGGDETFLLGPVDLTFRPGETVFICGGNGSGKSTLLSLITGLRFPDGGQILLDGKPVDVKSIEQYRSLFSAVFSQFHLFRKPYGLDEDELKALDGYIRELGIAKRVGLIEEGFSTLSLSTGQKRRLALAVALAEARPIVVLDEFAADQDPGRRAFFYDVLVPQMARDGHLVLVVTHDEHRFEQCDRLIRMEAGQVVAETIIDRSAPSAEIRRQIAAAW